MAAKLITPPASEPITLDEAKAHLRVDAADEDAMISALIVAARQAAEHITGRALMTQTWEVAFDEFDESGLWLQYPPLVSITSITYLDEAGAEQTLDAADYVLNDYDEPAVIKPAADVDWPATLCEPNAVTVRYVAGYANAAAVPQAIKQWMLLRIGAMYAHREEVGPVVAELPFADSLLNAYKVYGV